MGALRHGQGLFAGMGVAGSLVAAVGAGFALTGGVLAFHSWPSVGALSQAPELSMPATSPSAGIDRRAPLRLNTRLTPAARTLPRAAAPGATTPPRPAPRRTSAPLRGVALAPSPAPAPPAAPAPARTPAAPPTSALGDTVAAATGGTAQTVRTVVPGPVGALAGDTVQSLGATVADALDHLGR